MWLAVHWQKGWSYLEVTTESLVKKYLVRSSGSSCYVGAQTEFSDFQLHPFPKSRPREKKRSCSPLGNIFCRLEKPGLVIFFQDMFSLVDEDCWALKTLTAISNLLCQLSQFHNLKGMSRRKMSFNIQGLIKNDKTTRRRSAAAMLKIRPINIPWTPY